MSALDRPRVSVAFAMFCHEYDPDRPTDLRNVATGLGGWAPDRITTTELTLAIGLWNTGTPGQVHCRVGIKRPGEDIRFLGEAEATVEDPGEMAILPLKLTVTFDRPGTYWAIGEFDGQPLVEVPFTVTAEAAPTVRHD
jgi:hypothetical protein